MFGSEMMLSFLTQYLSLSLFKGEDKHEEVYSKKVIIHDSNVIGY